MSTRAAPFLLALSLAATAHAQEEEAPQPTPHQAVALAEALAPSLVRVEYRFQMANGEQPVSTSGRYTNYVTGSIRQSIDEERPQWGDGYLIAPDKLVTADFMVADRFVESIRVHFGAGVTDARPVAYAVHQNAVVLQLEEPLPGAAPLAFAAGDEAPVWVAAYERQPAGWVTHMFPLPAAVRVTDLGEQVIDLRADCLLLSERGAPLGATFTGALHLERPWRGGPLQWEQLSTEQLAAAQAAIEAGGAAGLVRARLTFRSPRARNQMQMMMMGQGPDQALTEWNGVALVTGERRAVVLAALKPSDTARLERVALFLEGADPPVEASFVGSLRDLGALVVEAAAPLPAPPRLHTGDVRALRDTLLLYRDIRIEGDQRVVQQGRTWFTAVSEGRDGVRLPQLPPASSPRQRSYGDNTGGPRGGQFTFTLEGELATLPVAQREEVTTRQQWSPVQAVQLPAGVLLGALSDLEAHVDPNNVPVAAGEEDRLAWLGVEMQALGPELARANGVAHLTQGGTQGGLIVFIYPGSPAEQADLQVGDILLRLEVEGQPKPLDVNLGPDRSGFMGAFPWDRLDELPEQYYEQMPAPWPPAETPFTRSLTDLGFGTPFTAQVARGGEVLRKSMQVVEGPPHYHSAERYESEALGLTGADLTYEVRRYLQRGDEEPGVVVAKLEMGGKASIAGIKPFELITHINGEPVPDVAALERLLAPGGSLRLSIKRLHRGRIVKVQLPPATTAAEEDGEADAETEDGGD